MVAERVHRANENIERAEANIDKAKINMEKNRCRMCCIIILALIALVLIVVVLFGTDIIHLWLCAIIITKFNESCLDSSCHLSYDFTIRMSIVEEADQPWFQKALEQTSTFGTSFRRWTFACWRIKFFRSWVKTNR